MLIGKIIMKIKNNNNKSTTAGDSMWRNNNKKQYGKNYAPVFVIATTTTYTSDWKGKKTILFALMYLKILADFNERYRPRSRLCIILAFSGIGTGMSHTTHLNVSTCNIIRANRQRPSARVMAEIYLWFRENKTFTLRARARSACDLNFRTEKARAYIKHNNKR